MKQWGIRKDLYWCPNCNIPLRVERCHKCGGKAIRLRITEPGDARPAFNGDREFMREAFKNEFNDEKLMSELGIDNEIVLLNRTPHYDDMKEVIVGGVIVGRLYFDPYLLKWRWRLSKFSAIKAAERGLIKVFRTDKVKPLEVVGTGQGIEGEQALVTDRSGNPKALAILRRGKFRIQLIFKDKTLREPFKAKAGIKDVIKGNEEYLRTLVSRSIAHIAIISSKVGLPVLLSYSGGKDSLLSLHLTLNASIEPKLLFNDTGLELPPVVRNVYHVAKVYGLEVVEASANGKFWDAVEVFGPPSKDYRWCCKVVKLIPIAKVYKRSYPNGVLVIIGQRGLESLDRSWSGRVWRNRWLPLALNTTPIHEWDQLMEWLYILNNRLPVNELYFKGFDRLGCFLCPAAYVAEYYLVSKEYPDLWSKWVDVLNRWCSRLGLKCEYWVRFHLWRWLNPLGQGRRRVEIWLGIKQPSNWKVEYSRRAGLSVKGYKDGEGYVIELSSNVNIEAIKSQYRVLGKKLYQLDNGIVIEDSDGKVIVRGSRVIGKGRNAQERAITALKLLIRWSKCVRCGSCELWCPQNAISSSNGKPKISNDKCIGCGICIEVCPISEIYVEKLLVTQLIDSPKSRARRLKALSIEFMRALRRARIKKTEMPKESYEGLSTFFNE